MTIVIADNSPRKTYTATAGQTDFPTDFAFFAKADVNVYVNGTLKTLDSDFSIPTTGPSAWTSGNDGTIVFTTGLSAGDTVVLTRDVELERTTDFPSSGPFQVATLNTELDKIVAMIADLEDLASRGITLADSDTGDTASLPDVTARKGRVLAFENDATAAPKAGPLITDVQSVADISADIATLADIEDGTDATDAISGLAAVASDVTTAASNITAIQNASANATTATTKATEAAASATTASTKASEASTSATTATTKASEAATSATNASTSATTATTKASEASTSATNAATSATSASTAQTAAETAQTAAETAQTAAETAKTGAETAKTAAETAKTGAETAKTAAETAQTAAETAETNAATSETNAATSATTATTKASEASTSATNAATSATSAASAQTAAEGARDSALAAYDNFDDRYLGVKTSDPTVDNDGDALVAGALYFNSTSQKFLVYNGSSWVDAYADGATLVSKSGDTMTGALTINADLTVDTNTLHVDSANNRVGINDATPSEELDINGDGSDVKIRMYDGAGASVGRIAHSGANFDISNTATSTATMTFTTGSGSGSERMRIDSSGNVGIGDTAPVTPLTIATTNKLGSTFTGTTNGEGLTVTQTNYTSGNYISLVEAAYDDSGDANPNVRIGAKFDGNGSSLAFGTSNSYSSGITNTAMFIDSSGNVGIGTSSPSYHVDLNAGTDNFVLNGESTDSGAYIRIKDNNATGHYFGAKDGNFDIYNTSNVHRFRIDSSGNVGIGTTSPTAPLMVNGGGTNFPIVINSTDQYAGISFADNTTTSNAHVAVYADGNSLGFEANNAERMRLNTGGSLLIGTTASVGTGVNGWEFRKTSGQSRYGASGTSSNALTFYTSSGLAGRITISGTTTNYQTSSDYRLKENVTDITDGITRLKQLEPKRFNFIHDADTTVDGFLAHQAQTVVPEAVSGIHNGVETWTQQEIDDGDAPANTSAGDNKLDDDGNTIPDYQGIDQSKLVPLLTAALQEAIAKIETLETKVAALETE